jgi:hypothetical protein
VRSQCTNSKVWLFSILEFCSIAGLTKVTCFWLYFWEMAPPSNEPSFTPLFPNSHNNRCHTTGLGFKKKKNKQTNNLACCLLSCQRGNLSIVNLIFPLDSHLFSVIRLSRHSPWVSLQCVAGNGIWGLASSFLDHISLQQVCYQFCKLK